jgi:hypothetical protein
MAATVTFRANPAGQHRLLRDTHGPLGSYMTRIGNQIVNAAKARANVDTGLMRSRIEFRLSVGATGLIGQLTARTNYAAFIHQGTRYYAGNPFLVLAAKDVIR